MIVRSEEIEIRSSNDLVPVRQAVRAWAVDLGFSLVEQTKIVTAASELARNVVDYAGSGRLRLEALHRPAREPYAWDGVGEVRPFAAMEKTIVEGVY